MEGYITDVEGVLVGHAEDLDRITGCTVVLCERGAVCAYHEIGHAAGTRALSTLQPTHVTPFVHGIYLGGGSAFGLSAAAGVMDYLAERDIGFSVGVAKVPIIPGAIIFDLSIGDSKARPTPEMARKACEAAKADGFEEGTVGAGTGATVGKLLGKSFSMKSGVGTASRKTDEGVVVGAIAVVNAYGDVVDPETGEIVAGARNPEDSSKFINTRKSIEAGMQSDGTFAGTNTTLAVVATNAAFDKVEAKRLARMSSQGLYRSIVPAGTLFDGDIVFALGTGMTRKDIGINRLGALGASALEEAILRAVKKAKSIDGVPDFNEV